MRVFQITPTAEVSEALARLAVTLPAIYAAGVLVKRGSALLQESQQLRSRTVAIKAIPLIAARFDDSPGLAQSFMERAYMAQLGVPSAQLLDKEEDFVGKVLDAVLKMKGS